jgi:hypothetical protein
MSQETAGISRPAEVAASLRRSGVKPLRATAPSQKVSVEELKNGGSLNLGGVLEESGETRTLRQRTTGRRAGVSARQSRSAGLSLPERLQKLAQIKKSATEYESLFVDQLVKLMRPSPLAHTPGGDTFSELAEQPFRDYLSRAGGLGLANTIVNQVARQEGLEQTLLEHPEVMGPSWRPTIPRNLGPKHYGGLAMTPAAPGRSDETAEIAEPRP